MARVSPAEWLLAGLLLLSMGDTFPSSIRRPRKVRGKLSLSSLRQLARRTGFAQPEVAAAVAMAESGGDPEVIGDHGDSVGLWQIHRPSHPTWARMNLTDPKVNATAALDISKGGTAWEPWTTYRTGAYKQYL